MVSKSSSLKGVDKVAVRAAGNGRFHVSVYAPSAEAPKNFVQIMPPERGWKSVERRPKEFVRENVGIDAPVMVVTLRGASNGYVDFDSVTLTA